MSVNSWPRAPTLLMPYIGLCGLLPVSFSDRAAIGKPLTLARVPTCVDADNPPRFESLAFGPAMLFLYSRIWPSRPTAVEPAA